MKKYQNWFKFYCILFLLFLTVNVIARPFHPIKVFKHKTRTRVIGFEKTRRSYKISVPSDYNGITKVPLVIIYHGGGGNAENMMNKTRWCEKSEREGFIAVFPEGSKKDEEKKSRFIGNPQTWNDGSNRENLGAVKRSEDDLKFFDEMLKEIKKSYKIDESKIYVTGFSNGASMTFYLGRSFSDIIAAIAPVAGSDWSMDLEIKEPLSLLYITGTEDKLNPLNGGEIFIGKRSFGTKPPVINFIQNWVKILKCNQEPLLITDTDGVRGVLYENMETKSEVVYYTVEGMGHIWPGGNASLPEKITGKNTGSLNATDLIWEFFKNHPKIK